MNVRIRVLRGFNELGILEGVLDPSKLPMNKPGEEDAEACVKQLQEHLVRMEVNANNGPLRLHVEIE